MKKLFFGLGPGTLGSRGFLGKIPWIVGKHAFLAMSLLTLVSVMAGIMLSDYYITKAPLQNVDPAAIAFRRAMYTKVLEIWQAKESAFKELNEGILPNPFNRQ
jgi:hypothetical protein